MTETPLDDPLPRTPEPPSARPLWSQRRAAAECGVSRSTIQRALKAGKFPNAALADDGWLIPVVDLLAAGFNPGRPTLPEAAPGPAAPADGAAPGPTRAEVEEWRRRALEAEAREQVLQARLDERAGLVKAYEQHIADLRQSLRMLEGVPTMPQSPATVVDLRDQHADIAPRRRWWRRRDQ